MAEPLLYGQSAIKYEQYPAPAYGVAKGCYAPQDGGYNTPPGFVTVDVSRAPHLLPNGPLLYSDDWYLMADGYYRNGCCYLNADDPNLCVPKRFGWGWTLNYAHRLAKVITVIFIVLIIAIAVGGVLGAILPRA